MKQLFTLVFAALMLFQCTKDTKPADVACLEDYMSRHNLIYRQLPIVPINDCYDYYHYSLFNGKYYLSYDNACSDILPNPIRCDEVPFSEEYPNLTLNDFLSQATHKGILLKSN